MPPERRRRPACQPSAESIKSVCRGRSDSGILSPSLAPIDLEAAIRLGGEG